MGPVLRYARFLASEGVLRGVIGPHEVPRLWERHLVNCAVAASFIPPDVSVCDVGSGAGLPGVVLALCRPDLSVTLLDNQLRRTRFLTDVVADLSLSTRVTVVHARAEQHAEAGAKYAVVTARAVAGLERLGALTAPLADVEGRLVAIRGESASQELAESRVALEDVGWYEPELNTVSSAGATHTIVTAVRR